MRKKIKQIIAAGMAVIAVTAGSLPAHAEEVDQYPLRGSFPYTLNTKESIDAKLADGWVFSGDPYETVGTAVPFRNNSEWAQINTFKFSVTNLNPGKILITLAGLTPIQDSLTGSKLTPEEEAVKNEVIKYLNSYDWRNASDYKKAAYTAEYIVNRCEYKNIEGSGLLTNSSYSCLINGFAVCDGFAQTYHLLTRAVGLKSVEISQDFHAFNYVNIDGVWRKIDVSSVANYIDKTGRINEFLSKKADDTSINLWNENGVEFEPDSTIPSQPKY